MSRMSRHGTGSELRAPGGMNGDRAGQELEVTPSVPHLTIPVFIHPILLCHPMQLSGIDIILDPAL